jgi:hypothetical protein
MPISRKDFERGFVMDWPPALRAVVTVLLDHKDQAFTAEELKQEIMKLPSDFQEWIHKEGFDNPRGGADRLQAVLVIILDMLKRTSYVDAKEISWPVSGGRNSGPVLHYALNPEVIQLPWVPAAPSVPQLRGLMDRSPKRGHH